MMKFLKADNSKILTVGTDLKSVSKAINTVVK
jgi:hypothetical protein